MQATAPISRISAQFRCSTLRRPVGVAFWVYSRKLMRACARFVQRIKRQKVHGVMHPLDIATLAHRVGGRWRNRRHACAQQQVARDRGGRGRPAAAMLHHDADRVARRLGRGVADEKRVVAAVPWQILVAGDALPRAPRR